MLPIQKHPDRWHFKPGDASAPIRDFVSGKSIFVVDVDDYDLHRSLLYALGAGSVANKMMAHVTLILHGAPEPPQKARAKYPTGEFVRAPSVLPLFHQKIPTFGDFVRALERHGFRVRNPSDEADATFDFFDLPLCNGSLHETLLEYLRTSPFIRTFARKQHFPIDEREDGYVDFPIPESGGVTWYYAFRDAGWRRVYAQRGEGDHPLEIKGEQLLRVAPVFWTQSTGMYFHEYPREESISGLFIQAGIDARTGRVNGAAISRVWT